MINKIFLFSFLLFELKLIEESNKLSEIIGIRHKISEQIKTNAEILQEQASKDGQLNEKEIMQIRKNEEKMKELFSDTYDLSAKISENQLLYEENQLSQLHSSFKAHKDIPYLETFKKPTPKEEEKKLFYAPDQMKEEIESTNISQELKNLIEKNEIISFL